MNSRESEASLDFASPIRESSMAFPMDGPVGRVSQFMGEAGHFDESVRQGWLMKNPTGMVGKWERRYFVIKEGQMLYYAKENEDLKGGMDLTDCSVEKISDTDLKITARNPKQKSHKFNVTLLDGSTSPVKNRVSITLRFGKPGAEATTGQAIDTDIDGWQSFFGRVTSV